MKTKTLTWLKSKFSRQATPPAASELSSTDHIEKTRLHIIESIVSSLMPLAGNSGIRNMTLWAEDAIVHQVLISSGIKEELATALDNAELYELGKCDIQVTQGKPHGMSYTTVLKDKLDVTFGGENETKNDGNWKCIISLVEGSGSMEQELYTITSASTDKMQRYCIGRGQNIHRNGLCRVNHIVIKSDETDEELMKRNSYVSSNQADIIAEGGKFYLQAMIGGCSNMNGSATKIFRGKDGFKLCDILTRYRLYDGDVIELGRNLRLCVSISQCD